MSPAGPACLAISAQMSILKSVLPAFLLAAQSAAAQTAQQPCPGNPDALSTSRVIRVDAGTTPRVGRKHFPATLPLADKEVVLTFDDGPRPGTTSAVLNALRRECVLATFFLAGRNAAAHPDPARRNRAESHTVAHHRFPHPLLHRLKPDAAEAEIDRGFAAVDTARSTAARPNGRERRSSAFPASPRRHTC